MGKYPFKGSPGCLGYFGDNLNNNSTVTLSFFNCHQEIVNKYNYKFPLLIQYEFETIDEIDLCNDENVNKAVEIIKKAIEDSK